MANTAAARLRRTLDVACRLSDRWLGRYLEAIHRPCPKCGHVPGPVPSHVQGREPDWPE